MNPVKPLLILIGLSAWGGLAFGQTIGDPAPTIGDGQLGIALLVDQYSRDLNFESGGSDSLDYSRTTFRIDYGLAKNRPVQLYLGAAEAEPDPGDPWSGTEVGLGYRQAVDISIPMGGKTAPTAVFADIRYGNLEDGTTFKYFQYQFGYGFSYPFTKALDAYASVLYSDVYGRIDGRDVTGVDNLGFMGGFEYSLTSAFRVSAELHIVHEFGFGLILHYLL